MIKEASRSIREVMQKEEERLSRMGKRLLIRLETKGIYSVGGEVRREMLSHRHNHEEKVVISNL
jgi:hypothetical protein